MAMARRAFQIKNRIMECLVTLRSFQVILECAIKATMVVIVVEISAENQLRSLFLTKTFAIIEKRIKLESVMQMPTIR